MPPHNNDRTWNINTLLISALTVLVGICGFFAKGIADDVSSTKVIATTISAQMPFMQRDIDNLKTGEQHLWSAINDNPRAFVPGEPNAAVDNAKPSSPPKTQ